MNDQTSPRIARARRPADAAGRSVWLSGAALALSMLACYGTLAAVIVLPVFGIALAPDDSWWSMAIVVPATLVVVALAWNARRDGSWLPVGLALAGTALLAYLMFWHMNKLLEVLAFTLLLAAVLAERRRCARREPTDRQEHGHV
jgi:predicted branched-subunit amino acid permease